MILTFDRDVVNGYTSLIRHEPQRREDDEASIETTQAVDDRDTDGISVMKQQYDDKGYDVIKNKMAFIMLEDGYFVK